MNSINAALIGFAAGAITAGTSGAHTNVVAVLVGVLVGICGCGDELLRMWSKRRVTDGR